MAFENHVILNGQVQKIIASRDKRTGNIIQISISLKVLRRPNSSKKLRFDLVPVRVRNKDQIAEIMNSKLSNGDLLEVSGVFSTVHMDKSFYCDKCGAMNKYNGTLAYVTPLTIKPYTLHPTETEIISIAKDECESFVDDDGQLTQEVLDIIDNKKYSFAGTVNYEILKRTDSDIVIRVYSKAETTDSEAVEWMLNMSDISNRIYLIGTVCGTPEYWESEETGSRVATYQLGVNRKVFIPEDDRSIKADYPFIKSLGAQAEKDHEALQQGSLVFVDGALQARDQFIIKKPCSQCGETCELTSNALEIVPYSVEYLRNCFSPDPDGDSNNDDI